MKDYALTIAIFIAIGVGYLSPDAQVSTRILGRRAGALFRHSLFLTASRMVLPQDPIANDKV